MNNEELDIGLNEELIDKLDEINKDILVKTKKTYKEISRRQFKMCLVGASLVAMLSGGLGFAAGRASKEAKSNVATDIPTTTTEVSNPEISEPVTDPVSFVDGVNTEASNPEIKENSATNYIKTKYNISDNDLGIVAQGSDYLFVDQNGNYVYDITMDETGLTRVTPQVVYTYVDLSNELKPIAGIVKTDDGYHNVNVKSSDFNTKRSIQDPTKYVKFDGSEEELEKYYEDSVEYLKERSKKKKASVN